MPVARAPNLGKVESSALDGFGRRHTSNLVRTGR